MGQVIEVAQLVSHGMYMSEAGVIERHAGKVFSIAIFHVAMFAVIYVAAGAFRFLKSPVPALLSET